MMLQQRILCALGAFALCISVLADLHADDQFYQRGTELTSQFEIEASTLRKSIRDDEFTFDLTVTNQSEQDYRGPLALVIEKTGVESLLPKKFDHHFADDQQGFLDLINESQTLKSGETFKLRRVRLKSNEDLESDPTEHFSLVARIYKIKTAGQQVAGGAEKPVRGQGLPGGIPLRLSQRDAGEPDGGLKPVPDPIGDTGEAEPAEEEAGVPPEDDPEFEKPPRLPTDEELEQALTAKTAWEEKLFDIEGVHGVGRGWGQEGDAVVSVFVNHFAQKKTVPSQLDGVPVQVKVMPKIELFDRRGQIGYFRPLDLCDDGDPRELYDRPSKIGVSGFNTNIFICATGTLGCRLEDPFDPSFKYILSNSHVFADGGIGISGAGFAFFGDPIYQPGPLDFTCANAPMGQVGRLAGWSTFDLQNPNLIDAAIARTGPLFFGTATPCNGYGVPRETTVPATIGMEVMKYGRTTSFTTGTVFLDSFDVTVGAGGGVNVDFVNQIVIFPDPDVPLFSFSGDSGSLIVTRDGRNPVGLLFAGNSFVTFANPIDFVLFAFGGLRVDGQP